MAIEVKLRNETPPLELLADLERRKHELKYTYAVAVYHCIAVYMHEYCGVFGDGDNGAYEWFVWRPGSLETSDNAYGSPVVALRDGLIKALPQFFSVGFADALQVSVPETSMEMSERAPTEDERRGMAWWNGMEADRRRHWLEKAAKSGGGSAADAWEVYKRTQNANA
jgi:hypothetical protein